MRYNPDTERGIRLEDVGQPIGKVSATGLYPQPKEVWDCANGNWIDNPLYEAGVLAVKSEDKQAADDIVSEATIQLWSVCHKLRQIKNGSIPSATISLLKRDVLDIVAELHRLT